MENKIKPFFISFSALIALCLAALYLPPTQTALIDLVERLKDDDIRDVFWKQQMVAFATCGIVFFAILNLILWTKKGRDVFDCFCNAVEKECAFIVQNKKYFIFLIAIYFLGYFTIIRGNFCYVGNDDLPRQLEGCREWVNWYRYIDEFGSILIHTATNLIDIAPLTQFIATFFVALASFIAAQAATGGALTWLACIAALPIGLFPYFLATISYRFDSPYMAISVFASVFPFAFRKDRINFIISSIIGILAMCTSYQASSGIYIVLTALCVLRMHKDGDSWQEIGKFILTAICCYAGTLAIFSLVFMEKDFKPGAVDERLQITNLAKNTIIYISTIWHGLGKSALKAFVIISLALGLFAQTFYSKRGKAISFCMTAFFYIMALPLSYGVYLAMGTPLWHPRAMYGAGVFVAAGLLLLATNLEGSQKAFKAVASLFIFVVSYCCLTYAFAFGNAQTKQNEYAEFRTALVVDDLSKVMADQSGYKNTEILFANGVEFAPVVKNLIDVYPLTAQCVELYSDGGRNTQYVASAMGLFDFVSGDSHHLEKEDLPVLVDTVYHKIQGKDNHYLVTFKEPKHKVIKTRGFVD